ncbi:MAG: hypothetical protein KAI66_06350 [Lentisphaeria bacterium]|nr:hypothetical protein [Lentisphaeria bacterium]
MSAYLGTLAARNLGNASLRLHLCALRAVFDKMLGMEITAGIVHAPRPAPRPVATDRELALLRQACTDWHSRLVIDMLNRSGFRPGELVSLAFAPPVTTMDGGERVGTPSIRPVLCFAPTSAEVDWLFPSPVRAGPMSLRTLQRRVTRLGAPLGFRITCTAVRKAPVVPMQAVA